MPYLPSKPPPTSSDDGTALAFYLEDELTRLAMSVLDDVQAVEVRPAHSAPLRPREGMLVYADGTDWNPGSGEGLYSYGSDAAWHLAGSDRTAWTAYTPTLVSTVGTITTLGVLAGRYKLIGKTCFVEIILAITTNGTGSSSLTSSLPFTPAATIHLGGREVAINGKTLSGTNNGLTTALNVCHYDNSYAGADGVTFVLEGVYEVA